MKEVLIVAEAGQVIYLKEYELGKGVANKLRGRKTIFPHRHANAKEGFFQITEVEEREKAIIVKGVNITLPLVLDDVDQFLFNFPDVIKMEEASLSTDSSILMATTGNSMRSKWVIINDQHMLFYEMLENIFIRDHKVVYEDQVKSFSHNLGHCFLGDFNLDDHDSFAPEWVKTIVSVRNNPQRKLYGSTYYAKIPNIDHHIPLVINPKHLTKEQVKEFMNYNKSMLEYWKFMGLKSLDTPELISETLTHLRRHALWDRL
jgi:hypothetical protein